MSHHIATSERATMEQLEFSDFVVNKLVAFNKIPLSHKNIWKVEITEILVETCCNPYPNLYDEIGTYCEEKDFNGHGVGILRNHLMAKIKKDKTVQGEEDKQSLEEYFISSSDKAKKDLIIRCLNRKQGWLPDYTRSFIRRSDLEFRTKVNEIRESYRKNEDEVKEIVRTFKENISDEKLSDASSLFDYYTEEDKMACVKNFLSSSLDEIPEFYLAFINAQSEDVKEELRSIMIEFRNKKR
jgi:hypothetical protein